MSDEAKHPFKEFNSPKPMSVEEFVKEYVTFRRALLKAESQPDPIPLTEPATVKELFGMWLSDKRAMEVLDIEFKLEMQKAQEDGDGDQEDGDGDQQDWWAQGNEGDKD